MLYIFLRVKVVIRAIYEQLSELRSGVVTKQQILQHTTNILVELIH